MKLLKCEQEVHISFCADETTATLYTSYPAWIRKMDKLVEKNPQDFQCIAQTAAGKTYAMPRNFVSIQRAHSDLDRGTESTGYKASAWYGVRLCRYGRFSL